MPAGRWRANRRASGAAHPPRAVSPVEVLDAYLAVIDALNPKLNAIVTLAAEQARDTARLAEAAVMKGEPLGPLHGLPIAVKDVTPTAGIRTTFASPLFSDYVPAEDAEAVRGSKRPAPSCSPRPTRRNSPAAPTPTTRCSAHAQSVESGAQPGGSSGGSAVAVAAGMVPIAQGTDYGCSIRIPAAFCGIVGLRPTPGLTPNPPMRLPGIRDRSMARWRTMPKTPRCSRRGRLQRLSPISVAPPWKSARPR